ncbi:lipopolysaccharide biosynthesis protein [Brotaphodocola sp.]|uniref:lipopolysaccharide biosynthesis protein n=1 Tax=Brotaphodocola sp. TaxID=3073577 RepID=UPI003D7E0281
MMNYVTDLLIHTGKDRQKMNLYWNMLGSFCYAFASMVLAFLVMRVAGSQKGGVFAFGYSTVGQQMFLLAYFGVRPFQITDSRQEYLFGDYLHMRYITCAAALFLGCLYVLVNRYDPEKTIVIFLLIGYKVIDGFADVYESEFQRIGRLYLTGKANTFRTILSVSVFFAVLMMTPGRNLLLACMAALLAQIVGLYVFDIAVLGRYHIDYRWSRRRIKKLFFATVLLSISVFLDFYVFSAAKYAIDANMNDAASGFFNIIFMPTSVINLAAGFVIRPFLNGLTDDWTGKQFDSFVARLRMLTGVISGLALLATAATALLGKPVLMVMEMLLGSSYEGMLTKYSLAFLMIVAGGGFYALLNLCYYVLVIMRRQREIFGVYVVMTGAAAILAPAMVKRSGINGAARSYLILMVMMAAGFAACAWYGLRCGKRMAQEEDEE